MRENTRRLTRSALGAAIGFIILLLSAVVPSARLALLCIASLGVVFVRMSCGIPWALGCYAVTALLGMLLIPSKGMPALYSVFFGWYPVVRLLIEGIRTNWLRPVLRQILFNVIFFPFFLLFRSLFPELENIAGNFWIFFLLGNVAFFAYDYALKYCFLFYIRKIARRLK